jgi:N-ethylmaleimide reductase
MLFTPLRLGGIELKNRVVMSPMTRSRSIGNVTGPIVAEYYAQRADAGLLITEGTSPSPNGLGYARIPGIFSAEQVTAWKAVADAVHAKGGRIFMQIMHTGRIGHPLNLPAGAEIVSPSAVAAAGQMWTDANGSQPHPVPRAMEISDIEHAIEEYRTAALNAVAAGFDGIELHAANGYLIDQFLNPASNKRSDDFGGSPEKRNKFALLVAQAAAKAIGRDRVGIRLSPYGLFNDMEHFPEIDAQYRALAAALSEHVAYIHLVDHSAQGAPKPDPATVAAIRNAYNGALILSGGYDAERAQKDLAEKRGDLIAFGRPFLANPDLVKRLQTGAELNQPDPSTFYTPGPKGYTDYSFL